MEAARPCVAASPVLAAQGWSWRRLGSRVALWLEPGEDHWRDALSCGGGKCRLMNIAPAPGKPGSGRPVALVPCAFEGPGLVSQSQGFTIEALPGAKVTLKSSHPLRGRSLWLLALSRGASLLSGCSLLRDMGKGKIMHETRTGTETVGKSAAWLWTAKLW